MAKSSITSLIKSFATSKAKAFRASQTGNVAMMTAVSSVVLLGGLAVALDMTRGINTQINLADATDAVALMIAKSDLETDEQRLLAAQEYLALAYPGESGSRVKVVSIVKDGDAVTVKLANNIDTTFGRIFERNDIDVSAGATAIYAERQMDIALVLDTTLSMGDPATGGGTKLDALKTAATSMVTTIEGYNNAQVRMSVVPFSNYVNVGLSRRNAPWLRVSPDSETTEVKCRDERPLLERGKCKTIKYECERDGVMKTCSRKSCDHKYGPKERVCKPKTTRKVWNGCVGSRAVPFDTRPEFANNRIPGLTGARCGTEIQPLTTSLSDVKGTINALTASGNTYMPSGLIWGWRTLDGRQPLASKDNKSDKVLILMTDGRNSRAKQGEWHEKKDKHAADAKTRTLCKAIDDEEITVYTIAYEVTDPATRTLLDDCATARGGFFNARNASELNEAFRDIGASLNELRISA